MASLPPQEIQYQLEHQHENRAIDIIAANTVMLTAAYVAVALRFTSRRLMHATLGADDWVMAVGLLFTSCFVAGCFVCVSLGMGKHAILLKHPVSFGQATLATEVFYTPASTSIKFSVLLLYRRLFPNRKLKIVSWCIAVFLVVFALAQMLSVIIQCKPVAALWDPLSYPDAICGNYKPALILFAAINAITDIMILCLPFPILWHLNASKTRRQQLIGIFSLGGLVCIVSICRTGYVHQVSLTDPSWDDVNTVILSSVENCAGIFSGCLPTMLPIWHFLRHGKPPKTGSSNTRQHFGMKLSTLKRPTWPANRSGEIDKKAGKGSFEKLQDSSRGLRPHNMITSSDHIGETEPRRDPHRIRVTTIVQQSKALPSQKRGTTETDGPEW